MYDWKDKKRVRQDARTMIIVAIVLGAMAVSVTVYNYYKIQSYGPRVNHVPVQPTDGGCGPVGSSGQACPMVWGGGGGTGVHGVVLM